MSVSAYHNNNNNNNNQYIYKQRQSHAMSQRHWLATAVIFRPSRHGVISEMPFFSRIYLCHLIGHGSVVKDEDCENIHRVVFHWGMEN